MSAKLFQDSELVKRYEEWEDSDEWARATITEAQAMCLIREVQVHHAGVTLITNGSAVGSGVFVKSAKGYGILTAGHVCETLRAELKRGHDFAFLSQGLRQEMRPGDVLEGTARHLPSRGLQHMHVDPVPDFGCVMLPDVDARTIATWATFVNITQDGPSLKQKNYELNRNAWVTVGFLEERTPYAGSVFHQNLVGSPEAVYERDGKRYLYVKAQPAIEGLPKSLGGMSGSGLWEIPVAVRRGDDTDLKVGTPILRGTVFRQEVQEHPDEPLGFYAHELHTIADSVAAWLDG